MRATLLLILVLAGCTGFKLKLAELYLDSIVMGTWVKDGSTQQDYFNDNAECQRLTSRFDIEKGYLFDLKAYSVCMRGKGWRLTPADIKLK